ncbi:MAG: hypothetical protein HZB13_01935 [Acidobacteria bacterium]|nr:hypothetical protein [Acidobacteriota bacterium]
MNKLSLRAILIAAVLATVTLAQMGGGMGNGMGNGTGNGMMGPGNSTPTGTNGMGQGMASGMGSAMGMSGAMGSREMMDGPTVGTDGTVYVVRLASTSTSTGQGMMQSTSGPSKYELVAISPVNGSTKWKLEIAGTMVSEPVLGKDGKIFLTASDFAMNGQSQSGGMMNSGSSTATTGKSRLLIVTAYPTTATISSTIAVDSDVLSAPRIADDSGSYVVYATGFEMGTDSDAIASGTKTLYAFTPGGQIKFSVKTNQP